MFDVKPITSPIQVDCGATCLQMLLNYYGIDASLNILTEECNTDILGCTAKDIKVTGNKYGLNIKAFKMSPEELMRQDRPAIIHWRQQHFCVFCGMENDKVVICNPDRGRFGLPVDAFKNFYSGTALFNGEPVDLPYSPTPDERIAELERQNEMLTECLFELADIIYA